MLSTWTPLQDKENTSTVLHPSSKARTSIPVKSTKLENVSKKKVFGDVGNTIRTHGTKGELKESSKLPVKSTGAVPKLMETKKDEDDWPEPESLPRLSPIEDDYLDCWPMEYRFSERGLLNLPFESKFKKPEPKDISDEPLPPITFEIGDFPLDLEPLIGEVEVPFWD